MAKDLDHRKIFFIILVIAIVLIIIYLPGLSKFHELASKNKELSRKIKTLGKSNMKLYKEAVSLKTDPVYLEKVAREKMKIVRPNEVIYKIQPQESSTKEKEKGR